MTSPEVAPVSVEGVQAIYTFFRVLCPPGSWTEVVTAAPMDRQLHLSTANPCPQFTFSEDTVFNGFDTAYLTPRILEAGSGVRSDTLILPANTTLYGQSPQNEFAYQLVEGYVSKIP